MPVALLVCLSLTGSSPRDARAVVIDRASPFAETLPAALGARAWLVSAEVDDEVATAERALAEASAMLDEANGLATQLKTDAAIAKYQEAIAAFVRGALAATDVRLLVECYVNEGALWVTVGNKRNAQEAFTRAHLLSQNATIDPKQFTPDIVARYNQIGREMARSRGGGITVSGQPVGAEVFLDGRKIGALPLSVPGVQAGPHLIQIRKNGFHRYATEVLVPQGGTEKVDAFLRPLPVSRGYELLSTLDDDNVPPSANAHATSLAAELGADALAIVSRDGRVGRWWLLASGTFSARVYGKDVDALTRALRAVQSSAPLTAPVSVSSAPVAVMARPPDNRLHLGLSLLPLGIAQFLEHRPIAGSALLITQLGLLAANIACFAVAQRDLKVDGGYANLERVRVLQVATNAAAILLIGDVIAGAIDGVLHR